MLRESDLLARFGGEEFLVLLPNTTADEAVTTAERLREAIASDVGRQLGEKLRVTVSLGVSELLSTDPHHEQVIQRVDQALYQAKEKGRDCIVKYT